MWRKISKKTLVYIILILIAIFLTFPFFWMVSTSLKGTNENIYAYPPRWIPENPNLNSFRTVIAEQPVLRYFINSLIVTGLGVGLNVLTAALAAYPLGRIKFAGKGIIFALILAPMMIPIQGTMIVNYVTLRFLGLVDTYLGVVITTAVFIIGVFILKNAYEAIPVEIEEAARVDGCGEFRLWWQIMVPGVKPSLAAIAILSFTYYWNDFMWPLIVLQDKGKFTIQLGLATLASAFQFNFRLLAAGIVLSIIPILIFFFFTQRYFIEGARGAVKG